jgi:hypothetical protein
MYFHLVFISHLDQDFKVRACACLSVVSLLLDSLLTSRTSALDISPGFRANAMCKDYIYNKQKTYACGCKGSLS